LEGLYVDIRSLLDETTQERYHERIGGEYMGKSGVIKILKEKTILLTMM